MSDPTTAPVAGPLRIGKLEDFARVRSFFTSADFDEASACSVLGIKDMSELYKVDWTQIEMDRIPGPLRWSLGVFLQGGTVSEADSRLVCGDDTVAKELALELAAKVVAGRALDAGPLASARALEGMTAVIVNLNKRYKGHAGVRVVGLP